MHTKQAPLILFISFMMIAQLACNALANSTTPDAFATLNGLYTASAQTLEARSPQPNLTVTPGLPPPTATAGATIEATKTIGASNPTPTPRCDAAQFVKDVTYADGSVVTRNSIFVKIWRIQNVGVCSWTTSYALAFSGGDSMNAPDAVSLNQNVAPGETIDLQITFNAPNKNGEYRSYWMLRNAAGVLFGIGKQADTSFWADITVTENAYIAYSFAAQYCKADWENRSGALPCPGAQGDANGFVVKLTAPVMENGATENEPALLVSPQDKNNGVISGQYPAIVVKAGDRFRTIVNCQYGSNKCDVIFRLDYKNNGVVKTLASWREVYEGQYYPVDLDLSGLAGETVKFILIVGANGENNQDNALWLNPHILRQGIPPTRRPTFTPTFTPAPTFTETPTP